MARRSAHAVVNPRGLLVGLQLAFLFAVGMMGSCRWPQWPDGGYAFDAYIPFIESITAPETAHVGAPVTIALTCSTSLDPGLLEDPRMKWDVAGGYGSDSTHFITEYNPIGHQPSPLGPPHEQVSLNHVFSAEDVGLVTLRYGTTVTRDQGGTKVRITVAGSVPFPFFDSSRPGFTYREVMINVLP